MPVSHRAVLRVQSLSSNSLYWNNTLLPFYTSIKCFALNIYTYICSIHYSICIAYNTYIYVLISMCTYMLNQGSCAL